MVLLTNKTKWTPFYYSCTKYCGCTSRTHRILGEIYLQNLIKMREKEQLL